MPLSPDDKKKHLQQKLALLREKYAERLPAKVAAIQDELKQYLVSKDRESLEILRRSLHKLKGSGATYGFLQVSEAAALFEDVLVSLLNEEKNAVFPATAQWNALLQALEEAVVVSTSVESN